MPMRGNGNHSFSIKIRISRYFGFKFETDGLKFETNGQNSDTEGLGEMKLAYHLCLYDDAMTVQNSKY